MAKRLLEKGDLDSEEVVEIHKKKPRKLGEMSEQGDLILYQVHFSSTHSSCCMISFQYLQHPL